MATLSRLSLVCLASVVVFLDTSDARGSQAAESPRMDRPMEVPVTLIAEGWSQPSSQVLLEARQQATMIYDAIDVSLVWTDEAGLDEETGPVHFVAVVLSDARTDQFLKGKEVPPSVLGVAPYQTGRVYVFWDRIARHAWENNVLPQIVLARFWHTRSGTTCCLSRPTRTAASCVRLWTIKWRAAGLHPDPGCIDPTVAVCRLRWRLDQCANRLSRAF